MSLNDIELPISVITELFRESSLIRSPATQAASPSTGSYKFLGNNQKKISILVDSPESAFLPDDQLAFLTKMLEACKMNIGDVAIVNQAKAPVDIALLKKQLSPEKVLLFGAETADIRLPLNIAFFKLQVYDQCTYLRVPPLGQLLQTGEESKLLKSKLWLCLRELFGV